MMKNELYQTLSEHIGHQVEINDIFDWETNQATSIEIRCAEPGCEDCNAFMEIDNPFLHE